MTWFEELTGFDETEPGDVRKKMFVEGGTLKSRHNGKVLVCGRLETPSLSDLRERVRVGKRNGGRIAVREVIADVQSLHVDILNAGALFQVASQFNLLEMVSPNVTPDAGVGIYEKDRTQGPACAIAAGAGTIYRNYFAPVNGQAGQSVANQIDCLADLGLALGNSGNSLWVMRNGYALATRSGLMEISERLRASSEAELDQLRALLRIGIMWNTQVTLQNCNHLVSQAYCSALPVAFCQHLFDLWEDFARLVLEAAYEATICAAIINGQNTGNHRLFLTLLGGGAFANKPGCILDGMRRALKRYADWDVEVSIVSYGRSNADVQELVKQFA